MCQLRNCRDWMSSTWTHQCFWLLFPPCQSTILRNEQRAPDWFWWQYCVVLLDVCRSRSTSSIFACVPLFACQSSLIQTRWLGIKKAHNVIGKKLSRLGVYGFMSHRKFASKSGHSSTLFIKFLPNLVIAFWTIPAKLIVIKVMLKTCLRQFLFNGFSIFCSFF